MNSLQIRSLMVAALLWGGMTPIGVAQIVPDATLGSESSVLNPALEPGTIWIEGGATRSSALFHSFSDFNVNDGQRVYFANPTAIETIFSRVTGSNPSQIFGTLGVGGSADLFLINPQGILFGPNARLDISGSFTASTVESLIFGNGLEFSSINPGAAPLLQVNVQPGLQGGIQEIQSLGELKTGQNLTLQGGNIEISGKLQAGGNLLLQGQTVNIFDQADRPLQLGASGTLKLEGADQLSISALRHPDSFLYGGKLTLRSDQPVIGDAHFYSGKGGFRVETLAGALNRLESPEDPVIRTSGDVTIAGYIGSSLHIIAGGSVTIESAKFGDAEYAIALTGTDAAGALQDTITLSDGTLVQIDGTARPTLDIRAGVTDPTELAPPGSISISGDLSIPDFNQNYYSSLSDYATPSSGNININGAVYLGDAYFGTRSDNVQIVITNQWKEGCSPNCLPGNISISTIAPAAGNLGELAELWIDSSGDLNLGTGGSPLNLSSENGNGGNLTALAQGNIHVNGVIQSNSTNNIGAGGNIALISGGNLTINPGYFLQSQGLQGGSIRLRSTGGDVIVNSDGLKNSTLLNTSNAVTTPNLDQAGNIELTADSGSIFLLNGARIESQSISNGTANLGSILLTAEDQISISGEDSTLATLGINGNSGDIRLSAPDITIGGISALLSASSSNGQGGNIVLDAGSTGRILITSETDKRTELGEVPGPGSRSGDITIVTGDLDIQNSTIRTFTNGLGEAGDMAITVFNNLSLEDSTLSSEVGVSAKADGGNIEIENARNLNLINSYISSAVASNSTPDGLTFKGEGNAGNITLSNIGSLSLQNGSQLTSSTEGIGNAGTIAINNADRLTVERGSKISTAVGKTGAGNAGAIVLNSNSLTVTGESSITSSTAGQGSAGSVTVTGNGPILIDNSTLSTAIEPGGVANPDLPPSRITLTADSVTLQNGAKLTSQTQGTSEGQGGIGDAGTIAINATNTITLQGASSILSSVGLNATGNAGGIQLTAGGNVSLLEGSILTASTSGKGNSGAIEITAQDFLAQGEDQFGFGSTLAGGSTIETNTAGSGDGGEINLIASQGLFLRDEGSGIFSNTEAGSTGNAGSIFIDPPIVDIRDGAGISVNSLGAGTGGNITLAAGDLTLDNNAFISASTVNSDGGQIFLTIGGNLLLLNNSYLSAAAGLGQAAGGNGGSITIDAAAILGFNNADISANAGLGNGGNITINSPILLGFVVENVTDTIGDVRNNISASGQASAGTIVINNSVDPSKGLDPLAIALADLASQVRQSCDISSAQTLNQFRIAGRGGLPSTPQDPLQSQATLADLRLLDDWISETPFSGKPIASTPSIEPILVPTLGATGQWQWIAPQQIRLASSPCN